jgi:acetylornithine/succinyldiaminopimelate/putrescine aminotransferase
VSLVWTKEEKPGSLYDPSYVAELSNVHVSVDAQNERRWIASASFTGVNHLNRVEVCCSESEAKNAALRLARDLCSAEIVRILRLQEQIQ